MYNYMNTRSFLLLRPNLDSGSFGGVTDRTDRHLSGAGSRQSRFHGDCATTRQHARIAGAAWFDHDALVRMRTRKIGHATTPGSAETVRTRFERSR